MSIRTLLRLLTIDPKIGATMSTSTLARPPRMATAMLFNTDNIARDLTPRFSMVDREGVNVLVVEDVPVFRAGTFRDSMGDQMTWEGIHIDQMVTNFNLLASRNIFADVPVRDGHPGFLVSGTPGTGKVVGWHTALRSEKRMSNHDGKEYEYLIATYEILDPEAQEAIKSGLWRSRSAEVGRYVTNDESEFWPVYQGFAYVDIPAVEGLNVFSKQNNISFMMEEGNMPNTPTPTTTPPPPTATPPTTTPSAPKTSTQPSKHESSTTEVFVFSINGENVTDYSKVQNYVNSLEKENASLRQFRVETELQRRSDFITSLSNSGRIMATQIDRLTEFAHMLTDEQYSVWAEAMNEAPEQPVLGSYGPGDTDGGDETAQKAQEDEVAILAETVKQHKRAGMATDKIANTESYKRLIALDPSYKL